MPSILIETGFVSNKQEEEYLNSEKGQDEIAGNITSALKNYITLLESQKTPAGNTSVLPNANGTVAFLQSIEQREKKSASK